MRLLAAAQEADLILVEGVMGLFDGEPQCRRSGPAFRSAGAGRGRLQHGGHLWCAAFGLATLPAWLALGRGAGEPGCQQPPCRHAAYQPARPQAWLGALMRNAAMVLPERHLGLTLAEELPDALARLDAAADALADTPLGQMSLADWQRWAVDFVGPDVRAGHFAPCPRPLCGLSSFTCAKCPPSHALRCMAKRLPWRDAAFCFIYAANLDCLRDLGARIVFSRLADPALPMCDAVWPGGYPGAARPTLPTTPACATAWPPMWSQANPCGPSAAA